VNAVTRTAVLGDLVGDGSDVAELTLRVWHDAYAGKMWYPIWDEAFCRWQLPAEDRQLHVGAYADDQLVGFFGAVPQSLRIAGRVWPIGVASWCTVDPEYRAQALTMRLLQQLEVRQKEAGLALSLGIVSGDQDSLAYRMWSQYARVFPSKMRFLSRLGYWAKLLDPSVMARNGLTSAERLGARAFAPVLGLNFGGADQWRPYTPDDHVSCARLLDATTRGFDWSLEWSDARLARQLEGEGAKTYVLEKEGGVAAFASVAVMPFVGRAPIPAGVLDLWCMPGYGTPHRVRALGGLCRQLRGDGLSLLLALRCAMTPAATFAATGFLPLPAKDHLAAIFPRDDVPLDPPRTWSLLFR
jgi:GNAT superfamily N-acetyltransferase